MRTKSYEQLERSYNRIDAKNHNEEQSLYNRVLDSWWDSSSPRETLRSYYFELNRKGRKRLLGEFCDSLHYDVFYTMLEQLDII